MSEPRVGGVQFCFKNSSGGAADVWTDKVQDGSAIEHQIFYTSVPSSGTATVMVSGPVVESGRALVKFTVATAGTLTLIEADRLRFR